MGHYWREMDPVGAKKHDERSKRLSEVSKKLQDIPLSCFTAKDIRLLFLLYGGSVQMGWDEIYGHIDYLEEIAEKNKKKRRRK